MLQKFFSVDIKKTTPHICPSKAGRCSILANDIFRMTSPGGFFATGLLIETDIGSDCERSGTRLSTHFGLPDEGVTAGVAGTSGKMVFQSFFMLTTVQPWACAW